jgi:tetratricopeptide (TPR) repeat protein
MGGVDILNAMGYVYFQLKDYEQCQEVNTKALEIDPDDAYALKGLGICLATLGREEEGIELLKKAVTPVLPGILWMPIMS